MRNPDLKELLTRAIENWKIYPAKQTTFGTKCKNDKIQFLDDARGCCLIGAGIIGREIRSLDYILDAVVDTYHLNENQMEIITNTFDGNDDFVKEQLLQNQSDMFLFFDVERIRKVVFGE